MTRCVQLTATGVIGVNLINAIARVEEDDNIELVYVITHPQRMVVWIACYQVEVEWEQNWNVNQKFVTRNHVHLMVTGESGQCLAIAQQLVAKGTGIELDYVITPHHHMADSHVYCREKSSKEHEAGMKARVKSVTNSHVQ